MNFEHKPVLLKECIDGLNIDKNGIYVDGTLGGAGHATEIIKRLSPRGMLIGIDQDESAIITASERLSKYGYNIDKTDNAGNLDKPAFAVFHTNFANISDVFRKLNIESANGILFDIGVSSYQLDEAERGFSYMQDAPLDMRMDRRAGLTAEHIINEYSEKDIAYIIKEYGEERWAARIASFIAKARKEKRIETTGELVEIIKAAIPASARREGPHPAKRTFQAIRIEVNRELDVLYQAIQKSIPLLSPGGRLCIITFHSLEDRIVKKEFQKYANPCVCPPDFPVCACGRKPEIKIITNKPIEAEAEELNDNSRARSARLRIAEKLAYT